MADCKRKTANLVDISTYTASGGQSSKYEYFKNVTLSAGTYTYSCRQNNTLSYATRNTLFVAIDANLTYESAATDYHLNVGIHSLTFTLESEKTIILGCWTNTLSNDCVYDEFMLNTGSTPLPYEPYGWQHSLRKYEIDTDTITTLPADIYADGTNATVGLKGNMSQTGIPTPTTPIQPSECGERTGNLFDVSTWYGVTATRGNVEEVENGFRITALSNDAYTNTYGSGVPQCSYKVLSGETYTLSWKVDNPNIYGVVYVFSGETAGSNVLTNIVASQQKVSFTVPSGHNYISFRLGVSSSGNSITYTNIMLNTSSTPLPYEPYGYKLDISSGGKNLFDYVSYFDSVFTPYNEFFNYAELQLQPNTTYTLSTSYEEYLWTSTRITAFIVATSSDVPTTANGGISNVSPITITTESDGVLKLYKRISGSSEDMLPTEEQFEGGDWIMLNKGSTPLPYEPYNRTTTSVYLGEVQTTRKIKKLVLTGEESWNKNIADVSDTLYWIRVSDTAQSRCVISHLQYLAFIPTGTTIGFAIRSDNNVLYFNFGADVMNAQPSGNTVAGLKEYLAAQYAAGTPVTVWYVLATEETTTVNEPLRKIGDYADTVSGITIPTITGKDTFDVETTLKPSEVSLSYTGWHNAEVKEKSAQLYFKTIAGSSIGADGNILANTSFDCYVAKVEANQQYIGTGYVYAFYTSEPELGSVSYDEQRVAETATNGFTSPIDGYVAVRHNAGVTNAMLNTGSTALPYEPYWQ